MKTDPDCIPCIIKQALNTLKISKVDNRKSQEVIKKVLIELGQIDYRNNPALNSNAAYHIFSQVTGIKDPYDGIKTECNNLILKLYPCLEEMIEKSEDSLYTAARAAIAGNVVDFGVHLNEGKSFTPDKIIEEIVDIPLSHDDYPVFIHDLENSKKILYIADNAGEIVFDKLFIDQIKRTGINIILAVKSGPIINDATINDARQVKLDSMVDIVETGNNCIGINFKQISKAFLKEFEDSDIIISKGQGNFESLDEVRHRKIFFLLKAKCEKIARELGVNYLDIVFMKNKYYQ